MTQLNAGTEGLSEGNSRVPKYEETEAGLFNVLFRKGLDCLSG